MIWTKLKYCLDTSRTLVEAMSLEREMEDSIVGEQAFARFCGYWHCEHLHIGQKLDETSSEMFRNKEKRPDFLVNLHDLSPIFVEVKTNTPWRLRKPDWGVNHDTFRVNHEEFMKIQRFEHRLRISTWYAFLERSQHHIEESAVYLCPVSRMEKWIPKDKKGNPQIWEFIAVPIVCMNKCTKTELDISDKCLVCSIHMCDKVC